MWSMLVGKFQKGACRYLLHRYLGQYLKEKVTVDQLTVDLYNGTGSVTDVSLDCDALNCLAEQHNLPIEILEGSLEEISFTIPWSTIMQDSCEINIRGLKVSFQPKNRTDNGNSMIDSMFTSMASSMQLAEECLKKCDDIEDDQEADNQEMAGLEHCAKTIEAILTRVKLNFTDTTLRIQSCKSESDIGIALEFHINLWKYSDDIVDGKDDNASLSSGFSHKKITLEGITCFTDIFSSSKFFKRQQMMLLSTTNLEETEEGDEVPKNLIQLAKLSGTHEIKLHVKVDESMAAPQVSFDCNFGSMISLVTPIQAHILWVLVNELLQPTDRTETAFNRRQCSEKPMDSFDLRRVEKELQDLAKPENIGITGLGHQQQGWSSACCDDADDEFHPFKVRTMYNSAASHVLQSSVISNTSMQSSMRLSMTDIMDVSNYKSTQLYLPSQNKPSSDLGAEKTKFSLSFVSISVILLHEDMLTLSTSDAVLPGSFQNMQLYSRNFFEALYYFGAAVKGEKDVYEVREKLKSACNKSHHRIIGAPVKIKGTTRSGNGFMTTSETVGTVAVGYFELTESLTDREATKSLQTPNPRGIEVLTFLKSFEQGGSLALRVDFKVDNRKTGRLSNVSKTFLKFHLNDCRAEIDVSVIDRITSLINSPLYFFIDPKEALPFNQPGSNLKNNNTVRINVTCPSLSVDFRFPIPDLRPLDDRSRLPHYVRNIHNDSILFQIKDLDFSTVIGGPGDMLELDTRSREIHLFYKKNPKDIPVLFATALADDPDVDTSLNNKGLDWPRVLVSIFPKVPLATATERETASEAENMDTMNFMSMPKQAPSVFSSKRVIHETTSHGDSETDNSSESVIPGDRNEISQFIEDAAKSVVYKIDLSFQFVEVLLPSKNFFEDIYNRIGNDLLLWEPIALQMNQERSKNATPFAPFSMCKSALHYDPDPEDDSSSMAFYSPSSGVQTSSPEKQKDKLKFGQSEVVFSLSIGKGSASFCTPVQDVLGAFVANESGLLKITVEQGNLFFVSGYKGDTNAGYLCAVSQKAALYHTDFVKTKDNPQFCPDIVKTIFPSDVGVLSGQSSDAVATDMLSVSIKINRDPSRNLKIFKVALGIHGGTLRHRLYLPNRTWFTQLTDYFDVVDNPVTGYTPCVVLTELHLHLWNCVVDYKPLHIPYRGILTMEAFSVSSNIAAQTSTSVVTFIAEDAAFFITAKPDSTSLKDDYVCVMDIDYFELCLRLCSNPIINAPRIDLSTASNTFNIRTCNDSLKVLVDLLKYYFDECDLIDPSQKDNDSIGTGSSNTENIVPSYEPAIIPDTEEIVDQYDKKLSGVQEVQLHDLVAEAMQDTASDSSRFEKGRTRKDRCRSPVLKMVEPKYEIHFAPDIGEFQYEVHADLCPPQSLSSNINAAMGTAPNIHGDGGWGEPSSEDDEEFCILENDPGVGIVSKSGEPQAKTMSAEPIRLVENYFTPPEGKMDALKAPKHYPNAVTKYALKDITIVWHMYGGDDLGLTLSRKTSIKSDDRGSSETVCTDAWKEPQYSTSNNYFEAFEQEVDIAIDPLNNGAIFSKNKAFESDWEAYDSPKAKRKQQLPVGCTMWRHQGGKGRQHDTLVELRLSKVKFVHETYPETTEQASRQVLTINNIEVLDKLKSSQFNKLLYLYTTPKRPRQTHANMVMIKAAHIRPDPQVNVEECCLKISVLPIRLNVDQDALLFLHQYFGELSFRSESDEDDFMSGRHTNPLSNTPSVESLPIMTVNVSENEVNMDEDTANLINFQDDAFCADDNVSVCSKDPSTDSTKATTPIYFRQVIFSPEVPIRLDYRGKRVDMTHGPLAGILMGLAQLNCSEIRLKHIHHRHGVLGVERLLALLVNEWALDIKKNQLPSLLGGVGPIHSFVQLFQGVRDLFWLPIEQYQKDGRIAKGLQRGVNAFSTSTAMAALDLTNKLIQTIQGAAEFTYDMVSPGPSVHQKRRQSSSKRRKRYTQPGDIREGMTNAYNVVREGIGDTAQTIVRVASKEHEQKGISGAVGGVLRQIPPTVVRPIILAAEATTSVLDGVRSQLEPEFKKENEEKWKDT